MSFVQTPPVLGNQYREDRVLQSFLRRHVPADTLAAIAPSLDRMGERAVGDLAAAGMAGRSDEPELIQWDAWGNRVDEIRVPEAWRTFARAAVEEGLVATAYERAHGEYSRLHQFALVYLFDRSTKVYTCPLAMTDGCARTLELIAPAALRDRVVTRLTSRDPARAWTSGQWMTERTGGSDVGLSETVARQSPEGWRLYGTKWFTSAITADVALTLARPEGGAAGGRGLALFLVETRNHEGRLNGIRVDRLKEKLGTRMVPTAELTLEGTLATPVAGLSDGVRNIAPMLNITRTWNAVCSAASLRRGVALARAYAARRVAFGCSLGGQAAPPGHARGDAGGVRGGVSPGLPRSRVARARGSWDAERWRCRRAATAPTDRQAHDRAAGGRRRERNARGVRRCRIRRGHRPSGTAA